MNEKAETLVKLANEQVGGSYVFGAWGELCTPAYRKKRAGIASSYKNAIYKYCPVLSNKQEDCTGCPHDGLIAADCRGFTDWLLKKAGVIDLYGDTVTTQYTTKSNWDGSGGTLYNIPNDPCIVFRQDTANRYGHTGFYDGKGYVIHAKGHAAGIVKEPLGQSKFTHWKIPRGLYEENHEEERAEVVLLETLKKGSSGVLVEQLQTMLSKLAYPVGAVDGVFGKKTVASVRAFQDDAGLTVDGICGPKTWSSLSVAFATGTVNEPADVEETEETENLVGENLPNTTDDSLVTRAEFNALVSRVATLEASGGGFSE